MNTLLFDLEKLKEDFTLIEESIQLELNIKGVKEPFGIKCFFKVVPDTSFAALLNIQTVYEPVQVGEARGKTILTGVRFLLEQEKYYAPFETPEGYYYGEHNWNWSNSNSSAYFVKKITKEGLEQLAVRSYTDNVRGEKEEFQTTIYYKEGTVYETADHSWWNKYFLSALEEGKPLNEAITQIKSNLVAIDERNQLYGYHEIQNPDCIRLLPNGVEEEGLSYSVKEWMLNHDITTDVTYPFTLDLSTDYHKDVFIIHSPRLVGNEVKIFTEGEWVHYPKENRYGQVASQHGTSVYVRWEEEYGSDYSYIRYFDLVSIDNPMKTYKKPIIVKFQVDQKWYGYGWLIEEGIHSKKIELFKESRKLKSYIYRSITNSFRANNGDIEKILINLHGCIPSFLLCHAKDVEHVSGIELKAVEKLLIMKEDYAASKLLSNLFKLADPKKSNHDYYLVQSLILHQSCKGLNLFERITDYILYQKEKQTFKSWFEEELTRI